MASQSCARCGSTAALQWYHTDPSTKTSNVSSLVSSGYGVRTILAEIAKCECLCAGCHRVEHYGGEEQALDAWIRGQNFYEMG